MTLLLSLSAGCGKRVEYLNGDHRLTRLTQDQPAPRPGVLISENYLAEIFEALGRPKPNADAPYCIAVFASCRELIQQILILGNMVQV